MRQRSWFRLPRLWRIRRSDKVLVLCVSFLLGLLVSRLYVSVPAWFVILLGIGTIIGVKKSFFHFTLLFIFGLSLGVWRGGGYLQAMQPYQEFAAQKVTLQAQVSLDAVYSDKSQLSFEVKKVQFLSPRAVEVPGTIKVKGFGEMAVYRGDVLEITGKMYPTRGGKQATISYAQFRRIASHQTIVDSLRRQFVAGMQTALPEPHASFGLGLLIGQRNTLPFGVTQALLMVGLTHIIAVSGYNLTILLNAARRMVGDRSKLLTVAIAIGLMSLFLLFTGASASIVRAAVVSGLGLAAWFYGRNVRPLVLIMLAAAITTYASPVYFWSDISWWLSILAFFGILVLAPQIILRLFRERHVPILAQIAIETLCAEAMTIPLVMFIFGQVSLIGLLANVLIALFIPLAMLVSFVAGLAGMLVPLAAGWFAWPATFILTYMLDTATILSHIPHSFRTNAYLSITDMVLCYALVLFFLYAMYRPRRVWFLDTDKP